MELKKRPRARPSRPPRESPRTSPFHRDAKAGGLSPRSSAAMREAAVFYTLPMQKGARRYNLGELNFSPLRPTRIAKNRPTLAIARLGEVFRRASHAEFGESTVFTGHPRPPSPRGERSRKEFLVVAFSPRAAQLGVDFLRRRCGSSAQREIVAIGRESPHKRGFLLRFSLRRRITRRSAPRVGAAVAKGSFLSCRPAPSARLASCAVDCSPSPSSLCWPTGSAGPSAPPARVTAIAIGFAPRRAGLRGGPSTCGSRPACRRCIPAWWRRFNWGRRRSPCWRFQSRGEKSPGRAGP